jgi:hypothetical protein
MKKSTRRERAAAHRAKSDKAAPPEHPAKRERRARSSSGNGPLVRNLVIIAGLILAIAFTWKKYRQTLATREAERQLNAQPASPPSVPAVPAETPQEDPLAVTEPAPAEEMPPLPEPEPEPDPEPPAEPPTPPEALSPAQSLIRLRGDLAAGKRDTMPVGTLRRGESDFFLVTTPMTWTQANGFADAYGGHLPLAADASDLGWLAEQLAATAPTDPARSSLWIGARKHADQWHRLDGPPLASPPAGEGSVAAMDTTGTLHARGDEDRHPFFIQWQRDGSNPASFRSVLARTKASLESPAPAYPPGTVTDGARHLLIVPRTITAADARELAELAGGHLMVPATPNEAIWIAHEATGTAFPKGLWLGATLHDAEWQWHTGEAWTFARWDPATPPGDGTALLLMPGTGWQPADPSTETSGFVIEWSRDAATPAAPATSADGPAELLEKSRKVLVAANKQRDTELAANARTFVFNLDAWLRTNNKGETARWKPRIEALKARVVDNRIPTGLPKRPNEDFSERMLKIAQGCLDKQNFIDADFIIKAGRIRDAYAARLTELATAEEKRGQPALARRLKANAGAAANLDDWLASLGSLAAE